MNYRTLGNTGLRVSEIGLGSEVFVGKSREAALALYETALAYGINFFDLYNPEPEVRSHLGAAMAGRRKKFIIQGHLCSAWLDGQYKRTRDIKRVKEAFEDLLRRLGSDYVDVGMIHYVDERSDYDRVFGGPVMDYARTLKASGQIHHIGMSTHNPVIALDAAKSGLIEVIMLSVNPAYDMLPPSEDVNELFEDSTFASSALANIDPQRMELYRYCEAAGIALTVMKPYAGGALLDSRKSPFGVAMTAAQCLHYCLTRPGVASVLAGVANTDEIVQAAAYCTLPEHEREYATLLSTAPAHAFSNQCMYCGHCAPCTVGIDIASVNKFADLCTAQGMIPETVREHYAVLPHHAGECVACGACEKNCPFGVKIIEHMQKAAELFGN